MYCSIYKLNPIDIHMLEWCRKRNREADNIPMGSKSDTIGREGGRAVFLIEVPKAMLCKQNPLVCAFLPPPVGLQQFLPRQVAQSETTKVVSVRNNLSLRHGIDLQGHPITPREGTPCLKLLCFTCLLREVGEISVCMELVTATDRKLKSKIIGLTAYLEGSQHFLAFADPLGRSQTSDESFCTQRIFSSMVLQDLSLPDASHLSGPPHCRSFMHCLDFFNSLMWWKLLREIQRNILVHLYLWASYKCFRIKLENILPEGISWDLVQALNIIPSKADWSLILKTVQIQMLFQNLVTLTKWPVYTRLVLC